MIDTCDQFLLNWSRYHDFIDDEFFFDIDQKSILEIGSLTGAQTQVLYKHDFSSLTLVEPFVNNQLEKRFPRATVITDDIFVVYQKSLPVDLVVCCGLLYHLHSPFHLLELIVNQSNPQTIILDNVHAREVGQGGLLEEDVGSRGDRHSATKTIPYSVAYSYPAINSALDSLGYNLNKFAELNIFPEIAQKSSSWMARWEKR